MQNITVKHIYSDNLLAQTETAYELNLKEHNYEKLLEFLNSDSFNYIYYALLKIERFKTKEEAAILLKLLNPENDSRIREQATELIKSHLADKNYNYYFNNDDFANFLIQAIKDKNPKVCRNIAECLKNLNDLPQIVQKLVNITKEQVKDKAVFAVYWGLFAIESILKQYNEISLENLIPLLQETSKFKEYQIREKTAAIIKILVQKNQQTDLMEISENLLNDDNFYVRAAISR